MPRLGWVPLGTSMVPSAHLRMVLIHEGCFDQPLCHICPCGGKLPEDTAMPHRHIYERKKREGEISFENQKPIKTGKRWAISFFYHVTPEEGS